LLNAKCQRPVCGPLDSANNSAQQRPDPAVPMGRDAATIVYAEEASII
jgi:hypothetical protein